MEATRVLIVDDDLALRRKVKALVEAKGAVVVGEAMNGLLAIEEACRLRPDVILLDISMPVMGGFAAARTLRECLPETRILFLSQYSQSIYVEEALKVGACGYLLKAACASELGDALKAVMDGGQFISSRAKGSAVAWRPCC